MKRKTTLLSASMIALLAITALTGCKKDASNPNCKTCWISCFTYTAYDGYMYGHQVASGSYCGSATQIANYKSALSATYNSSTSSTVNFNTAADETHEACDNTSEATYVTGGYTCH
jgi:hypothetical protein